MITIQDFQKGQSSSPYLTDGAFAKAQNLDIFRKNGVARINELPVKFEKATTGIMSDLPVTMFKHPSVDKAFYVCDNNNRMFYFTGADNNPPTTASDYGTNSGKFGIHWKGYLLGAKSTTLRYYSAGWNLWQTLGSVAEHFMIHSEYDDKVYICDDDGVAILEETAGQTFDPTSGATFNFAQAASAGYVLPDGFKAFGLAEQKEKIIIAAIKTKSAGIIDVPETTFFVWDRTDAAGTFATAESIISFPEANLTTLKTIANRVYITGGQTGNVYIFSESGLQPLTQIPFDYTGKNIRIGELGHQSIAYWNDMLLLGVSSDDGLYPAGIYALKDGKLCHQFLPSELEDGSDKDIRIGAIFPMDPQTLFFGWENNTDGTWGIDKVTTNGSRYTGYNCYLESLVYPVGTKNRTKSFDKVEVQLAKALVTGQGVKFKYREEEDGTWITLGTVEYTAGQIDRTLEFPGIHGVEQVQVRVELTSTSTNSPEVLTIRLLD